MHMHIQKKYSEKTMCIVLERLVRWLKNSFWICKKDMKRKWVLRVVCRNAQILRLAKGCEGSNEQRTASGNCRCAIGYGCS